MGGSGLFPILVRFGLVLAPALVGIALVMQFRHSSTPRPVADKAIAVAPEPTRSPAMTSSNVSLPPTGSAPGTAASGAAASFSDRIFFNDRISLPLPSNVDLSVAAKLMLPAPPQTELALQGADPRRLQVSFQRGMTAMKVYYGEAAANDGARLINLAARLGYEPARVTIVRDYPKSAVIRAEVSSDESVRYSLDPLIIADGGSDSGRGLLVSLATYFSNEQQLQAYASGVIAALLDDRRLQTEDRLNALLDLLTGVRGACTALSFAVAKSEAASGPECSSGLKLQLQNFLRVTAPPGLEAESRRQALQLLGNAS